MIYLGQNPIGVSNYCMPGDYDEMVQDVAELKSTLEPAASSSDIGKFLKAKTVADDKVTEYELSAAVTDVQVNETSVVSNGIANVPVATASTYGVVKTKLGGGTNIDSVDGSLIINTAGSPHIKAGAAVFMPIAPLKQHEAVFYGLAKAAGHDEKDSTKTLGTYTPGAKAAIQSMLGVEPGVCFVETVSGTTPSITGEANVRYICGTVSTISITPPSIGTIDVKFTSGSTPAILTLPSTVKFPEWVDMTTLEADTVYEIMITDGVYGGVMTWQG